MISWSTVFEEALPYEAFLDRYASREHRRRWDAIHDRIRLSDSQKRLLNGFTREMPVLVLCGAWCGDCINQCPILDHFAQASPRISLRFLDRDARPEIREALAVNGGQRVPVVVWLSEDFYEVGRFGDRTLAGYRQIAIDQLGPACPSGIVPPADGLLSAITAEWLDHFERAQLLLRLSGRLRDKHGD